VGRSLYETRSAEALLQEAVDKARTADYVIVFGGLNKSDYQDCEGHDRKDYQLPYGQNKLVEALAAVNPRVVFVNISGNASELPWIDRVPAVVQGWFIGSEAGEALASVLVGDVNPSGKLPFTWYTNLEQCGAHALKTYPGTWREGHQIIDEEYKEDIFVGYRWTDRLKKQQPLFAFGHGLSYTTFQLSNLRANQQEMTKDGKITFTVDVTNTGSRSGAETVQLYISDSQSSVPRPVKELKGFSKVYLQPGETKAVSITVDCSALSFYDDKAHAWTAEPGEFVAIVNNSSSVTKKTMKLKFRLV
jgi:beta-glucosidase